MPSADAVLNIRLVYIQISLAKTSYFQLLHWLWEYKICHWKYAFVKKKLYEITTGRSQQSNPLKTFKNDQYELFHPRPD